MNKESENDLLSKIAGKRLRQMQLAMFLIDEGVEIIDPARFDCRGTIGADAGVVIDIGCIFDGHVELGEGVQVGAYCVLKDVQIAAGTIIEPFSHLVGSVVGPNCKIGPFARIRPGSDLGRGVHIGNFVEIKNSTLRAETKANHLAYVGDADFGERVNFGAGAITANYDGANKFKTRLGPDVHIGSNSVLIAPVTIPAGATIAGSSTVTGLVGDGLTITRAPAKNKKDWSRPQKR